MATFREITYMVLDLLKERSDDSYYTEEHILFLASKMRALLLERKLKQSRNSVFTSVSDANRQEICLTLSPTNLLSDGCGGKFLRSNEEIPDLLESVAPRAYVLSDVYQSMVTLIPVERMPYVGYNKWLQNIIYAARSADGHLYLRSNNTQFIYLENMRLSAVFSDPLDAAKYSCSNKNDDAPCDPMEKEFPLEDALIPECIEMVVNEIAGPRYAPDDRRNNATDDLADVANARTTANRPARAVRRDINDAEAQAAQ